MIATPRTRRLVGLAVLAALVALAGCGAPTDFCYECPHYEDALEETANVEVDRTTVHVEVDEDGDTRYRFRAVVGEDDAALLRENPERLMALQREIGNQTPARDFGEVGLDGDAVVVTWDDPTDWKQRIGGIVLFDGPGKTSGLGVDRVEFHGPPGWAVTKTPDGATVEDGTVVFTSGIPDDSVIAFAPDDGWEYKAATWATVNSNTEVVVVAVGGLVALLGILLVLSFVRIPVRALGAVAVLATLGLVGLTIGGRVLLHRAAEGEPVIPSLEDGLFAATSICLAGLAVAIVGFLKPVYADHDRVAPVIERGGRFLAVGTFVLLPVSVLGLPEAAVAVGLVAPAVFFLPLGYAAGVESLDQGLHSVMILLAPFGLLAASVPADSPTVLAHLVAISFWAVATVLVGLVLFVGGYAVAVDADPADLGLPSPRHRDSAGSPGSDED